MSQPFITEWTFWAERKDTGASKLNKACMIKLGMTESDSALLTLSLPSGNKLWWGKYTYEKKKEGRNYGKHN